MIKVADKYRHEKMEDIKSKLDTLSPDMIDYIWMEQYRFKMHKITRLGPIHAKFCVGAHDILEGSELEAHGIQSRDLDAQDVLDRLKSGDQNIAKDLIDKFIDYSTIMAKFDRSFNPTIDKLFNQEVVAFVSRLILNDACFDRIKD